MSTLTWLTRTGSVLHGGDGVESSAVPNPLVDDLPGNVVPSNLGAVWAKPTSEPKPSWRLRVLIVLIST